MQWGHDADAKLFMNVLKIHSIKLDYTAIAQAMGNDVTPKAIIHRIAKIRSMADDASTSSSSAPTPTPTPAQPTKRTSPAKRASTTNTTAAATPGKKALATTANKTPVGTKRNAAGNAKSGKGNGNGGNGKAGNDSAAAVAAADDVEDEGMVETQPSAAKKSKTSNAAASSLKNGIKVFEDGSAGVGAGGEDGGVEYA